MNKEEIQEYMIAELSEIMGCDKDEIDENASFFKLGITSIQALKVINKVRRKLNVDVNPAAIFEYKCIADLAEYLSTCEIAADEDDD